MELSGKGVEQPEMRSQKFDKAKQQIFLASVTCSKSNGNSFAYISREGGKRKQLGSFWLPQGK